MNRRRARRLRYLIEDWNWMQSILPAHVDLVNLFYSMNDRGDRRILRVLRDRTIAREKRRNNA